MHFRFVAVPLAWDVENPAFGPLPGYHLPQIEHCMRTSAESLASFAIPPFATHTLH